jgi:2-oxoisovalerate dehydrogenase E1 component
MPKSILVDPAQVRGASSLKIKDIPVNVYKSDFAREKDRWGQKRLEQAWYDMAAIREFETMLNSIKTQGAWNGIEYNHKGPAHLSIGQEASSVGQALALGVDDFVFGSHRSHGEILAKCFSAIHTLDETKLEAIMKGFLGGETLAVAERIPYKDVRDLAENFVLYGTLAEIFARSSGFTRGLGGSMHAFFTPFGSMPNNAIVGGSADIAVGAALFKRINRKPGIVIANIGDASMGCGPVWEALCMASMDQYRELWPESSGGAPPVLFNFFNNFYGMGGQTSGETMGYKILARVGAGVNPENMHAERVDGYNPLAVADATSRKKKVLLEGKGPALLDVITYRVSGHSGARPPRRDHLPGIGALALGRLQLSHPGRDQALAGSGRRSGLWRLPREERGGQGRRARRPARADYGKACRSSEAGHRRQREPASKGRVHRIGDVLQRKGGALRRRHARGQGAEARTP